MSEEMNVQKRVVNTQSQLNDNTFERILSHMGVIERHFKDDLNWINTISNNNVLFATVQKEGVARNVLHSRMLNIEEDLHSLRSMKDYLIKRYGIDRFDVLMDMYTFENPQKFLIISLQNDINRLVDMGVALLHLYAHIIDDEYDGDDEMPSVNFDALTKQRKEEMRDKE